MNVDTGALYEGTAAIQSAEARGEPLVRIGAKAVAVVKAGNRAKLKRTRKMAKQSRKRNRGG